MFAFSDFFGYFFLSKKAHFFRNRTQIWGVYHMARALHNDPRQRIGNQIWTKANNILVLKECEKRFGSNAKNKVLAGVVVVHPSVLGAAVAAVGLPLVAVAVAAVAIA